MLRVERRREGRGTRSVGRACALLVLAIGAVLAAAGCGGRLDAAPSPAAPRVPTGAQVDVRMTTTSAGATTTIHGSGLESADGGTVAFHVDGRVAAGGGSRAFTADERVVANVLYLRSDALPPAQLSGRHWIRLGLGDAFRLLGIDVAALTATDPLLVHVFLRTATIVREPGHPIVGGVRTTPYRVLLHLAAPLPADLPARERALVAAGTSALERVTGNTSFRLEIWRDDAGRVRRERCALDALDGSAETIDTTVRRLDVPVSVAAPPLEDTVVPLADAPVA